MFIHSTALLTFFSEKVSKSWLHVLGRGRIKSSIPNTFIFVLRWRHYGASGFLENREASTWEFMGHFWESSEKLWNNG